jgi:hypothetical protein
MKISVTEGKSHGDRPSAQLSRVVRVFVNNDLHYGVWIDENEVLNRLTQQQVADYLSAQYSIDLDVPVEVAQAILDLGSSPYTRQTLF